VGSAPVKSIITSEALAASTMSDVTFTPSSLQPAMIPASCPIKGELADSIAPDRVVLLSSL